MIGQPAPLFTAPTDAGSVSLAALRGRKIVLYFYPKDSTPGCTIEAQGFRDLHDAFAAKNVTILGVSKDTPKKHASFKSKESLPFTLVSDEAGLCEAYGAWREKTLYGRKYMGIARVTFLIDETGIIRQVWDPVKAAGHAREVLDAIEAMG
ncbi:MAG: thioredoxin-dependent thiol peroxidase [Pseudomonadota bacterium]|nr:thioredoxin-dependent thiol peroxidase [Pseudomonadota bacterium]